MSRSVHLPGLDVLRAGMALGVVALHAGIPYMSHPLPGLRWCLLQEPRSGLIDALCWGLNLCVMPVFFLLAGWLAADLLHRHSLRRFVVLRTQRLLIPLAVGLVLVLPADLYIWLCGWVIEGSIPIRKMQSLKLPAPWSDDLWGVAHLWFLECLWGLSLAAAGIVGIGRSLRLSSGAREAACLTPTGSALGRTLRVSSCHDPIDGPSRSGRWTDRLATCWHPAHVPGLLLASLLTGGLLWTTPTILIGFRQAWLPGPATFAFYAVYFAAGCTWPRRASPARGAADPAAAPSGAGAWGRLGLSTLGFGLLLPALRAHVVSPRTGVELWLLTTGFTLTGWLLATGLFTGALSVRWAAPPRGVQFAAAASLWMYLVHHPLVGLAQLALRGSGAPAEVRFAATLLLATALSWATYVVLVRNTWLGRLLEGGRSSGPRPVGVTLPFEPAEAAIAPAAPARSAA